MAKSILTITLNPSVDKSTRVQHIVPEKKLRCEKPVYSLVAEELTYLVP